MTEARRTLDWEKQLALSIDPENAAKIHGRTGQHPGNNVPCTMCGGACVYLMLPQQRKYEKDPEKLEQSSQHFLKTWSCCKIIHCININPLCI